VNRLYYHLLSDMRAEHGPVVTSQLGPLLKIPSLDCVAPTPWTARLNISQLCPSNALTCIDTGDPETRRRVLGLYERMLDDEEILHGATTNDLQSSIDRTLKFAETCQISEESARSLRGDCSDIGGVSEESERRPLRYLRSLETTAATFIRV